MQEIRLVFVVIHSGTQAPGATVSAHRASRIVAGGNRLAAKERTPLPHERAELHRGIAANAGARRLSAEIRANKWLEHRIGELALKVLNVEWDLQLVRHATRIIRRIKGATTLPPAIHPIRSIVKSHPHTNNLVSSLYEERCCNGGIYAARERNEYTLRLRPLRLGKPPAGKSECVHVDRTSVRSRSRTRAHVAATSAATRSASPMLFVRPKEIRIPPRDSSSERPQAASASDGSREPLMQADPVEMARPA
jgi:hypothetical protein